MSESVRKILKQDLVSLLLRRLLFGITVALMSWSATAQTDPADRAAIEIINIEHRDPTVIRNSLYSVLDPRGTIGQLDNKLVIATTASNLARLKNLIRETDIPRQRLIVSVDFDHSTEALTGIRQHRIQAIEGDQIRVVDVSLTENIDAPALLILAEIRDETAHVSFQLENVGGFTGRYTNILPLGEWYIINPQDDSAADLPGAADLFDPANVMADAAATQADNADADVDTVTQIALRVDVMP